MKIRQVSAAERLDTMFPLQSYAFEATSDPEAGRLAFAGRQRYFETSTGLVAEEDGVVAACVAGYPMRENVRGKLLDMAGVAGVASDPAYRRRGYVRALLDRLLRDMKDQGHVVSVLWPFRPSFYERFGYVGLPQRRRVEFDPAGIAPATQIKGTVERKPLREGFDEYDAFVRRIHTQRHGFAVFDEVRTEIFRDSDDWVALAKDEDGETRAALAYKMTGFGGELQGRDLLADGPLGRALLLRFLGRHVDQVRQVSVVVGPDEVPELWGTDLLVTTTARVDHPDKRAPMGRVLDVEGLDGIEAGSGGATVEVVDDEVIKGVYRLESDNGRLRIDRAEKATTKLTAAGLSGLVYGVLDPVDVITRGLGEIGTEAVERLREVFPRKMPQVFSSF